MCMNDYVKAGNPDDIALGRALISSGKVGCIVLAGGDGSRLGWEGPKGTYPISLVKQKTLFQLLYDRVQAASASFGKELKLAVMTSPLNHEHTRRAFPDSVDFFTQNLVPMLDTDGNVLGEERPNGNGEVLKRFYESGLYEKWRKERVEYLQVILIDNPLAEPFDPNQIGIHFSKGADLTLKAILRENPEEKVGVIGKHNGKLTIIEYSENPPKDWNLANTSLFSFHMDFVDKTKEVELPHHEVKKFIGQKPVLKQECFIFDLLPFAEKSEVILYPRKATFAPLKNRDDVGVVQRALLERDKEVFHLLTGEKPKEQIFELDAAFYYPTETLKEKWKGKSLPDGSYILP